MRRRALGMSERRRLTRPRTKVYDANYSMGESYYKSALDGLDRKYGKLPTETMEPPRRPVSVGDFDSLMGGQAASGRSEHLDAMDEEMAATLKRIQKARMAVAPSAEESFENAFFNRREEVKKRYSEKMLESVGLNGSTIDEEMVRRRRLPLDVESDLPKISEKWTAMRDATIDNLEETAAKARARASKARLADIEAEMDNLAERGAARERRIAGLRQLLDSQSEDSAMSSVRLRKKVTTITEKRVI